MNKFAIFTSFIIGVGIGSVVTWRFVEKKYEQYVSPEEVEELREHYQKKKEDKPNEEKSEEVEQSEQPNSPPRTNYPNVIECAEMVKNLGYIDYNKMTDKDSEDIQKPTDNPHADRPYVISPEEFGYSDEYEKISLTYYADQVLADDDDRAIHDVEEIVGFDSLNHFGEYEDDSVFVRNDRLKVDYEILLSQLTYAEILAKSPYKAEMLDDED